ncbi:ABC transporter substrate-binding protein [Romboutsia sp.]|uniref:ABC transporter substrate-binding protein n=1 Tax=Romboutsia sp. TaxID=1965302 RepID=UPI003F4072EF
MKNINLKLTKINPLTMPVIIADKMGIFEKNNIKVNLRIDEEFVFDGNKDFLEGKVDAMVGDITFFFYMLEKGKKAVVTSNLTRTIQVVGKNYPKDMKNLKVGVNRAGLFRLYLENDLKEILPGAEVVWLSNSYERLQALEEGKIHALVAIEPFISDVIEKGGDVIWKSKDSDKNLVMWSFDEDFYKNNRDAIIDFHKSLEEAQTVFNSSSSEEKVKMCIKYGGYSDNLASRMATFEFEKQDNFRIEDFELCQEWMYREKEITKLHKAVNLVADIFS